MNTVIVNVENKEALEAVLALASFSNLAIEAVTISDPSILDGISPEAQFQIASVKPTVVEQKPRQLKRLSQLKGLTIASTKLVQSSSKCYIKTTDGAGLVLVAPEVKDELAPDEHIALGLLTREDMASIAKAKKMGIIA